MRLTVVYILVFCSLSVFGQNTKNTMHYRDSFLKYEYSDTNIASSYLKKMMTNGKKNNDVSMQIEYFLLKGWLAQDASDFHKALSCFQMMLKLARKNNLTQDEADAYGNIANIYDDLSEDVKRMQYHQLSLEMNEKILAETKDPAKRKRAMAGKSAALGNLAHHYMELNQYGKAIELVKEAMKIDSLSNNTDYLSISYITLGNIYKDQRMFEKALRMFFRSIAIRKSELKKNNDFTDVGLYQSMHNIGNIHKELDNLDSAEYYYLESMKMSERVNDRMHKTFIYASLGDLETRKGRYEKAVEYHLKAYDLSISLKSNDRIFQTAEFLSKTYSERADFKNAYQYLLIRNQYRDSLVNADKLRDLGRAEVNYKFKFKSSLDSVNYAKKLEEKEKLRKAEEEAFASEAARKNIVLYGVVFILVVVSLFSFYLIRLYREKKKANEIISEQKKLSEHHLEIIEEKQKEIVDSINYAKRIQYALLAHDELLKKHLSDFFVLFKPKDIVSGDFYWFTHIQSENNNFSFLAVCDSTGHGVPGAFMSLLNISFINEAISEKNIFDPGEVFNHVRKRLIQNLGSDGQKDGFDGILLRIDHHNGKLCYAGANNSPIVIENNKTEVLSCDKMPVGKGEITDAFNTFEISVKQGSMLFLPTDGYSDQFGGEKARPDGSFGLGKKLKFSNMLKIMNEASSLPVHQQKEFMNSKFEDWKGDLEQLDDVCVIGLKL
jgi:serine phosphatase RsbU (regulator of sigma subunit)